MDIHEVLRLLRDGASDRETTSLVGLNRRMVARYRRWPPGKQQAAIAVGHTILVIVYHLLVRGEAYEDLGGH